MCVSNPEIPAYVVDVMHQPDYLKNLGKENDYWWRVCLRHRPVIDLSETDAFGYCHCADCLAMDSPKADTAGKLLYAPNDRIIPDRYARFWQRVYERAAQHDPNVKVSAFIYFQTFPAPLDDIRLSPNIIGQYVPWFGGNSSIPMKQTAFTYLKENWLAWRRTGISLVAAPNIFYGGWVLPYFSSRQLWEWLEFTRDNGAIAYQPDGMNPDRFRTQGLAYYLCLRFMEQPNLTMEQARAEYFSAFGPAASAIERYWDYWETWSHQIAEKHGGNFGTRSYQQSLSRLMLEEKMFDPAFALLDEARAATQGQPGEFEARVKFLWAGLENARLSALLFSSLDRDLEILKVPLRNREKFEAARAAYRAWRDFQASYPPRSLPGPNNVTTDGSDLTGLDLKLLDSDFEAVRLPEEKRAVSR
jgi:hypothetical protein